MKIPPAHEFIQFRDFHTRLTFAFDDEIIETLETNTQGNNEFRRLIARFVDMERLIQGRERDGSGRITMSWSLR